MIEEILGRRQTLKTAGKLVAVGSVAATAGCTGGDEHSPSTEGNSSDSFSGGEAESSSDSSVYGEVGVIGPAKEVTTKSTLSPTSTGYVLDIKIVNGSDRPVEASADVVWFDEDNNNIVETNVEENITDADQENILKTEVEDPENIIISYFATVVAVPA